MSSTTIKERSELAKENTWATEDIFASDDVWQTAYNDARRYPGELSAYKGRLNNARNLLEFFQKNDEAELALSALYRYASLKSDEDTTVSKYTDMVGKAYSLYVETNAACAFATPEMLNIPAERYGQMYREEGELVVYRRAIDRILEKREHVLSEKEERLLAMAGELGRAPDEIASKLSDADIRYPDVDTENGAAALTQASYAVFRTSSDRRVRKDAFEKLHNTQKAFENTYAATLDAQVKQLVFFSRARGYASTLEAALSENEVPVSVYRNLIDTVHDNMDKMYRYIELRKRLLGEDLHMYDLYVPMVADTDLKVSFEQAKKNCLDALAPLGKEYCSVIREGFENRWIDPYQTKGKRSGAYSSGARPHPYVLLNYNDDVESEFTLIHEMGHSLHSYFSCKNQPVVYSDYVIFVAEVASTCNEVLLMKHLLATTSDRRVRAYLINYFLEQFRTTLYRQTMFAEFELKINEMVEGGATLTADALNELYYELNRFYYGDGITVDKEIASEWSRIPHFYYNFYVFQYATGFSAAVALAEKILSDRESAEDYIEFLSGGCHTDPITLLREAGVDMSSPEPISSALSLFGELIDELDKLI